ncbi:MAG: hypothetical protein ACLU30_18385 [Odoribacter splanchnicus]
MLPTTCHVYFGGVTGVPGWTNAWKCCRRHLSGQGRYNGPTAVIRSAAKTIISKPAGRY